ncbi:MAG: ABC transporter substrate-binding protein, partial [Lachnospiraceae bacterium]|nr:ABC transporter substrate-binding protein [Lachnospiraceae bacterium]
ETTGTNVSVLFLDNSKKYEQAILMDVSKLGTKVKVDGKKQRTVLSPEEIEEIINTFNNFEFIVDKNPDYIFVMDRDAAIGTDGAKPAREIMENDLVKGTDAYKNGNIIYLANPAVWYTAEGGIGALDIMLSDLESELLER